MPDVSVVIVSWNVAGLLADCLDSLLRCSDGLTLEVWVVDNASSDNTVEMVRSRYPWVQLIANADNRGFAAANNQAFQHVRGRFVFILNPDTVLEPRALQSLVRFLEERGDAGMVGPYMYRPDAGIETNVARRMYTLSAALWIDSLRVQTLPCIGPRLYRRFCTPYDYTLTREVEAISGAAMLVRRELLDKLQGFAEVFIHGGEDLDLCFRVRAAGWKVYYDAAARFQHLGGQSNKQASVRRP